MRIGWQVRLICTASVSYTHLFMGINPGPGLYNETNYRNNDNKVPFRILTGDSNLYRDESAYPLSRLVYRSDGKTIALDWFTKSNYCEGSSWYELKIKRGNGFVENMLKIICKVAFGLGKGEFVKGEKPEWYDTSVSYTHLFKAGLSLQQILTWTHI